METGGFKKTGRLVCSFQVTFVALRSSCLVNGGSMSAPSFVTESERASTLSPITHRFPAPVADTAQVVFEQTVPRHLVHRAAVAEVLLTDIKAISDTTFQVAAQWPRDHSFYRLNAMPYHDPMLLAETLRQAGLAIGHTVFEVPLDWQFMSHDKTYRMTEKGLSLHSSPADILLSVTCDDIKWRGKRVGGMRMFYDVYRDGSLVGTAQSRWSCVSPAAYQRLRPEITDSQEPSEVQPLPVAASLVGREQDRDVVLAPLNDPNCWLLRADPEHPVLFDHPIDHVPGMTLLEAARQAAKLALGLARLQPIECEFSFKRYVELNTPTIVRAEHGNASSAAEPEVRVFFEQSGKTAAIGSVRMCSFDGSRMPGPTPGARR